MTPYKSSAKIRDRIRQANVARAIGTLAKLGEQRRRHLVRCEGPGGFPLFVVDPRPISASQQGRRYLDLMRREARARLYLMAQLHSVVSLRVEKRLRH